MSNAPTARPRRTGWIVGGIVAGVLVVAIVAALVIVPPLVERHNAEERYVSAIADQTAASDARDDAMAAAIAAQEPVADVLEFARIVAIDDVEPYVDQDLFTEVTGLVSEIEALDDGLPQHVEAMAAEEFDTTEEYIAAAEDAERATELMERDAAIYRAAADGFTEKVPALESAVEELRGTIPEQAARVEEENISAENRTRIHLYYAADLAATSEESVSYYVQQYADAARAVEQSQEKELAEKDQGDGLIDTRLEIEEFVRSIVGDTRVDFDWAPIVNNLGDGYSAGGITNWQYLDGGYATIILSNSVARFWPESSVKGLVVHESGHAITSQCQDMLNDTFGGDVELMATAWAIGMGYDDPWGNGVDFYYGGVPPAPELVEASKSCR